MKVQAVLIAAALAFGAAYAQAADTTQAPSPEKHKIVKMHKAKKVSHKAHASLQRHEHLAKAKVQRHEHLAKAKMQRQEHLAKAKMHRHEMQARAERREERHEMHARAHLNTRTLGAGPSPSVNLNSTARERRMDQAYADWQNRARR